MNRHLECTLGRLEFRRERAIAEVGLFAEEQTFQSIELLLLASFNHLRLQSILHAREHSKGPLPLEDAIRRQIVTRLDVVAALRALHCVVKGKRWPRPDRKSVV